MARFLGNALIVAAILAALAAATLIHAATPVALQQCAVTPNAPVGPTVVIGCPRASISFAAVAPTTLTRSVVAGKDGWRPFSSLKPMDIIVAAPSGAKVPLSSVTPLLGPLPPPNVAQTVTINWIAPTQDTSGAALPATAIVGYKVYLYPVGAPPKQIAATAGNITSFTTQPLMPGTYAASITSVIESMHAAGTLTVPGSGAVTFK